MTKVSEIWQIPYNCDNSNHQNVTKPLKCDKSHTTLTYPSKCDKALKNVTHHHKMWLTIYTVTKIIWNVTNPMQLWHNHQNGTKPFQLWHTLKTVTTYFCPQQFHLKSIGHNLVFLLVVHLKFPSSRKTLLFVTQHLAK